MNISFFSVLTFFYAMGGIITFIGFVPTIVDLWKKKPSANITTYLLWIFTASITLLYGIFILKDRVFIIMNSLQLLAFTIILVLSIRLRFATK